jgi:outer membrane protein assembly factor BamB
VLHTNSVEVVSSEFAAHHHFAESGQVMLSMRTCQALALLDLEAEKIVWAQFGPYRFQHDPDLLDNGHILLFDNRGSVGPGGASRVIEFDPGTNQIVWQYAGDDGNFFYSPIRSAQQQLPNGNLLVTESCAGRLLEVTRAGEVVWEFRNPAQLDSDDRYIAVLCGAERYRADELTFVNQSSP